MSEQIVEVPKKIPEQLMETPKKKKKRIFTLELFIVIMLGITAVCTAWASWVGSVHASNQNEKFTISNNIFSEANALFNKGGQEQITDIIIYNDLNSINVDINLAKLRGDTVLVEHLEWKRELLIDLYINDEFYDAILWAHAEFDKQGDYYVSPFQNETFQDEYLKSANELFVEGEDLLNAGRQDGSHSRSFGLATVIYAVVLFLLGVDNSFKTWRYRIIIFVVACTAFLFTTIYMSTIPRPEGLFG
ncbi:MAG: hypothetical protein LBC73_03585 [Oscillospiraceae bacterium]|jgi:hypothetical protein|nr:hypothetical protein [Oscillospiraceae bacterium]